MINRMLAVTLLCFSALAHADTPLPSTSIYHLDAQLTDQRNAQVNLTRYRGTPVLVTMFYATCPKVCPLLIESVRSIESELTPTERSSIRVLMITLDPKRDTPIALAKLAKERQLDTQRWTLATASEAEIRKIAAVLSTQYRRLPDGEFNHASVITLLDRDGSIRFQSSRLGKPEAEMLAAIRESLRKPAT